MQMRRAASLRDIICFSVVVFYLAAIVSDLLRGSRLVLRVSCPATQRSATDCPLRVRERRPAFIDYVRRSARLFAADFSLTGRRAKGERSEAAPRPNTVTRLHRPDVTRKQPANFSLKIFVSLLAGRVNFFDRFTPRPHRDNNEPAIKSRSCPRARW